MQKIPTADGSDTFYNETYGDMYHTKSGAVEESFGKYVGPCKVRELARKGKVQILDICFGLGYNTCAAIDAALEENPDCEIFVLGLEKHDDILEKIPDIHPPGFKSYGMIKELVAGLADAKHVDENRILAIETGPASRVKLLLVLGDATSTIKDVSYGFAKEQFDCVFHDPFSPPKNPELWTESFFSDVIKLLKDGGILATYSCARHIRDNLKAVGFAVENGPVIGRRGPSTVAVKR